MEVDQGWKWGRGAIMNLGSNTLSLSYQRDVSGELAYWSRAKGRSLARRYI